MLTQYDPGVFECLRKRGKIGIAGGSPLNAVRHVSGGKRRSSIQNQQFGMMLELKGRSNEYLGLSTSTATSSSPRSLHLTAILPFHHGSTTKQYTTSAATTTSPFPQLWKLEYTYAFRLFYDISELPSRSWHSSESSYDSSSVPIIRGPGNVQYITHTAQAGSQESGVREGAGSVDCLSSRPECR
jgi:hypothetical protein